MNRKEFITSTSLFALTAFPVTSILSASKKSLLPVIDTHQHLWDTVRFNEGWSSSPMKRNFDMAAYKAAIQGRNIVKSVYIEVAVPPDKRREEALYAIEMCMDKSSPTSVAIIAADLNSIDFKSYLSEFTDSPYIRGIRHKFRNPEEITNPLVIENVKFLGEMNMSLDFSVPPLWLPHMADLIGHCPSTMFLVNHSGNVDPKAFFGPEEKVNEKPGHDRDDWIRDIKNIASYKNTACKISGVITRVLNYPLTAKNLAPSVNQCLDIFGPDRVMFASDWPVCLKKMELGEWLDILKEIVSNRPYEEQRKLFHDNAVKFYRI